MEQARREAKVITFITEYKCDKCGEGSMIHIPENWTGLHKCNVCGELTNLPKQYPIIETEYQ